ncbi:polyphosphate kinase 1 [Oenococcus oeni]|uniref:polyphosphate kinase 1 n=1 Tax=Oenococcus oeni TaxID=1247 RepID=UPI000277BCBF|nr:polyphosphate kinase 1 [Oenococcus oeni]EJO08519.1 polyphosphate kinase [Oenococcus oeni AWRIB553]
MLTENKNSKYLVNRELSWLKFNDRVLAQANDQRHPLLERARFLSITQKNLDEWFMVRLASIHQMVQLRLKSKDPTGLSPTEELDVISLAAGAQLKKQHSLYARSLVPMLAKKHINILGIDELEESQYDWLEKYFQQEILPILTPMADDGTRPFLFLSNDSLNLGIRIVANPTKKKKSKTENYAFIQVPKNLQRVIKLPIGVGQTYVLIEDVIREYINLLFQGYKIQEVTAFHLLRDMELSIAEEDSPNLLKEVQTQLKKRERGQVIRLVAEKKMSKKLEKHLQKALPLNKRRIYRVSGPVDLAFLDTLIKQVQIPELIYQPFQPRTELSLMGKGIFKTIADHDVLLQHPYDDYGPVVNLINQAADDDQTMAIKMTLYRVSDHSPIVAALGRAAEAGKQVTTLVEVKARFDEENNVHWAEELEKQGVHVIYGLPNLKVHAKMTLIIRKESSGIKRYMHVGTGNYNEVTARLYTDISLFTSNDLLADDLAQVFNYLTGYFAPKNLKIAHISPNGIADHLEKLIDAESEAELKGQISGIWIKANSLNDTNIIEHLIYASQTGVPIHLLIRGIETLKPEIKSVTNKIKVHSIVGRFLEHSRIYRFANNGNPLTYISSADLMPRNLYRRVELLVPIVDPKCESELAEIFETMWADTVNMWKMKSDGSYARHSKRRRRVDSQALFMEQEFVADRFAEKFVGDEYVRLKAGEFMTKFAIIDLGSNSIRMTISQYRKNGEYEVLGRFQEMVRLSAGMGRKRVLQSDAIDRTIQAVKEFKKEIAKYDQINVRAVATAAVRQASNQEEFLERFQSALDQPLEVISGIQEAHYDYMGIIETLPIDNALILDTGGASLEMVMVRDRKEIHAISLPVGAVNISETYLEKDKISAVSFFKSSTALQRLFRDVSWLLEVRNFPIVAIGGSNRTLAKISRRQREVVGLPIHGYHLPSDEANHIFEQVLGSNLKERGDLPGLAKNRADIIVGGMLPIIKLFQYIDSDQVIFSQSGLREGILFEEIQKVTGHEVLDPRVDESVDTESDET